ncbi:MAG TPA: MOSC domain-containing protein [Candidatus Acidoferrales bacterium]|nr:MOSC domain-containing protein [Candidatus Acidoferrales bacterium]
MSEALHLFQCPARGEPMQEFEEVFAVENKGFQNCVHGRSGSSRQVLLMDVETLEKFDIPAGRARENITTSGIKLDGLQLGQILRVGEAVLEVAKPCTPCHLMDDIRPGLKVELQGRRGLLCRVVEGGWIRRGDRIEVAAADRAAREIQGDATTGISEKVKSIS